MKAMSFYEFRSEKTGSGSKVIFLKENKIISLTIVVWNCQASYKSEYAELLVLHLLLLMNLWLIVKMWPAHHQNVVFSIGITLVDVLQNWLNWILFLFVILIDFMISVSIPRCYKDGYVNSFFPRTARLWNSLPIECFPLTYDLSGFKSRINRYLLTVGFF